MLGEMVPSKNIALEHLNYTIDGQALSSYSIPYFDTTNGMLL